MTNQVALGAAAARAIYLLTGAGSRGVGSGPQEHTHNGRRRRRRRLVRLAGGKQIRWRAKIKISTAPCYMLALVRPAELLPACANFGTAASTLLCDESPPLAAAKILCRLPNTTGQTNPSRFIRRSRSRRPSRQMTTTTTTTDPIVYSHLPAQSPRPASRTERGGKLCAGRRRDAARQQQAGPSGAELQRACAADAPRPASERPVCKGAQLAARPSPLQHRG